MEGPSQGGCQGFGAVHLGRPSLSGVPDVFYPRFIAEQEKWKPIPDSVVTFFFHFGTPLAVGPVQGGASSLLLAC